MSFIIKDRIHTSLVESIYNEVISRRSNYYYFIGKILAWNNPASPDAPAITQSYETETRNRMIAVKKIQPTDLSFVVPRINWNSGTVYDQFDGDYSSTFLAASGAQSLKQSRFYVLTSDFNVYKCLFNNNNAASTVKPTGTEATTLETADGYVWKFMYTLPLSLRNRFLTEAFMPVQRSVLNPFYSRGEVDRITIDNPGFGYFGNVAVSLRVNGEFASGGGNVVSNLIPVFNTSGSIINVVIRNPGNNYISANISIVNTGNTGTGLYNTAATANLIPVLYNGRIDRVLIADPGIDYSTDLRTTVVLTGDGANATLQPFVNESGEIEDLIITNRGEGYTYLDIEIVGSGSSANASADFSTGDLDTTQSTVELAAIPGAIHAIKINTAGDSYSNANIAVYGDGSGFTGTVVLSNTNTISKVLVTNPGSGYTYANVVFTGSGANATGTPILSPVGGHGSNAIKELFADTLMFYSTINNEKIHGVDVNNDYRQFGIIKDLKQFANTKTFANTTGTSCFLITANTVLNTLSQPLASDTILEVKTDRSRKFEVVEVTTNNRILLNSLNNYSPTANIILNDPITDSDFVILNVNNSPIINKFSGDLLFIDNRTKVSYSDQQLVTLRTVIKL